MGDGQATSDQMVPAGIEPVNVEETPDPPLDPAPHRLIAGLIFMCYPLLTGFLPGTEYKRKERSL